MATYRPSAVTPFFPQAIELLADSEGALAAKFLRGHCFIKRNDLPFYPLDHHKRLHAHLDRKCVVADRQLPEGSC